MTKKIEEGIKSDFLLKLKTAVDTGNPDIGKEAINKINEIHKLADNMNTDVAQASFDKRVEEAGEKKALTPEEREIVSLENEKQKIKVAAEEEKLKIISDIKNAEFEIKATTEELDDVKEQYFNVISAQEDELNVLKIRYEAKYDEKYGE